MIKIEDAPVPTHPTQALIGVELEIDAGPLALNLPDNVPGWRKTFDGSLDNGNEFVMADPLPLPEAKVVIEQLCRSLVNVATYRSGGLHVHVQTPAHTLKQACNIAKLYTAAQPVINTLVGKSRVRNTYCPEYPEGVTENKIIETFTLRSPASTRSQAKSARRYSVVNLAMFRCSNPLMRSAEFRQGSASKRSECVYGWAVFVTTLAEMAKDQSLIDGLPRRLDLESLLRLIQNHERAVGATNVAAWVKWRHDYMNQNPDEVLLSIATDHLRKPLGLFGLSRELGVNLAVTSRVITRLHRAGRVVKVTKKLKNGHTCDAWVVDFSQVAHTDLQKLVEAAQRRSALNTAQPVEIPV
jgi:hypothetical protein